MTRADLLVWLAGRFSALGQEAALLALDNAENYGPALDDAYAALGQSDQDVAALDASDPTNDDLRALGRYFTLRLFAEKLSTRVDTAVNSGEVNVKRSQVITTLRGLLADALADITHRGYGQQALQLGRIQLDILEPANEAIYGYVTPFNW